MEKVDETFNVEHKNHANNDRDKFAKTGNVGAALDS
jgi:hypothetical protein